MTSSPIGMALVATDGTFMAVNPAMCRFLQRDEHDVLVHTPPRSTSASATCDRMGPWCGVINAGDGQITATMSIGVTIAAAGDTVNGIVARADDAMYSAKSKGRNQVVPIQ